MDTSERKKSRDDLFGYLEEDGLAKPLRRGKLMCCVCGDVITRETYLFAEWIETFWTENFFIPRKTVAYCNKPECTKRFYKERIVFLIPPKDEEPPT